MKASIATVTITGIAPLSQSHKHDEPKLEGESHEDYDIRTWRNKLNTEIRNGKLIVVIPASAIHQSLAAAAKYSSIQIPGQGKKTWTKKFEAGIALFESPSLNIDPATVRHITISANSDGKRGSGSRVPRRFPSIPPGWTSTFEIVILDPIVTEPVLTEMLNLAGMYIGVGQYRPENGGTNGRFNVDKIVWADNRQLVTNRKIAA